MPHTTHALTATLLIALSATGCSHDLDLTEGDPTPGIEEVATFELTESYGCGFLQTCPLSRALAVGSSEGLEIVLDADDDEGDLKVVSTDPSILRIDSSELGSASGDARHYYRAEVFGVAGGDVRVLLLSANNALVDQVDMGVRQATAFGHRMVVDDTTDEIGQDPDGGYHITKGQSYSLIALLSDAEGLPLYANDAVTWKRISGPGALSHFFTIDDEIQEDRVFISSQGVGTTVVRGQAGALEREVAIQAE